MQRALAHSFEVLSTVDTGADRRDIHVANFFAPGWNAARTSAAAMDIAAMQSHAVLLARYGTPDEEIENDLNDTYGATFGTLRVSSQDGGNGLVIESV